MFLQLSLIIFFLLPLAAYSVSTPNPECPDRCGDLAIRFPFGVGPGCSLDPSFNIICNTSSSTDSPKPYITTPSSNGTTQEVVEINELEIRIRSRHVLNIACYNESGSMVSTSKEYFYGIHLDGTQYTFSEENWLTAIGCDDMVLGMGDNRTFGGGCTSFCVNRRDHGGVGFCPNGGNGYSPGNGCCRTPIPRGLSYLGAKFIDISKEWRRDTKLFPCSYAFVEEKFISDHSNFSYQLSYLNSSRKYLNFEWGPTNTPAPVIRLDWRIGAENCSQALKNTSYVCQNNSECVDANIPGYHCRCLQGYQGNPYLSPGCTNINECGDNSGKQCHSNSVCIDTPGSFICSCQQGYYGDGSLNGIGCKPLPTSKNIGLAVGLGCGIGFVLLLLIFSWLYKLFLKRKEKMRREKLFKQNGGPLLEQKTNEGTIRKTKHFRAVELEKATDHFNESRILGQGGQGTVYKGMLSDGKIVAIKKSKPVNEDQLEQFINEIVILSQVDHRNVVKLLGCCLEDEVPLLVYEFAPNGTLFSLIHDRENLFPISWNMRLKIAADIAGALAYLHTSSSIPIYHRDVKSSNILLGEKYAVKVSDFGTSKSVEEDKTHLTTLVKGTIGYIDPEYFQTGQFTEKSDVYSFGVVLVELLTGQRPVLQNGRSLVMRFLASMEERNLGTILDPLVIEQDFKEEVIAVARLAQRCLNFEGKMRPTMNDVAINLASYSNIAQTSSTVEDEFEDSSAYEPKPIMISDIDYIWTTSGSSDISSSSDTHPFMYVTV